MFRNFDIEIVEFNVVIDYKKTLLMLVFLQIFTRKIVLVSVFCNVVICPSITLLIIFTHSAVSFDFLLFFTFSLTTLIAKTYNYL
jgi:hypothetical protein